MDTGLLNRNAVPTVNLARLFGLPMVQSTVNVASCNELAINERPPDVRL